MTRSFIIAAVSAAALTLAGTAIAADEKTSKEKATPTVQIDDNHLRVTECGELKIIGPKGEVSYAQLQLGKSRFRNAGVEHDVINNGPGEMVFIEIELKDTVIGRE